MTSMQGVDILKKGKKEKIYNKNSIFSSNQKSKAKEKKKGGGKESKFGQMISTNKHAKRD